MYQDNPNNPIPNYDYYAGYHKNYDDLYAQERCPEMCPIHHQQCLLKAGHWGEHQCPQGDTWF